MADHTSLLENLGLNIQLHDEIVHSIGDNYSTMITAQKSRPSGMAYFDTAVHESHGARIKEIIDARNAGAKMIGTFCIYVPEEIILAAGAIPVALCGGTGMAIPHAEKRFPRDICPLIKSTLGLAFSKTCPYAPIKDMGVGETTCDAKKKTWDILSQSVNFHILEVPQKKTDMSRQLWLEEVRAFAQRVELLTENEITYERLADSILLMNRKRRLLKELNAFRKLPNPPISGRDALVVMQMALSDDPVRFCEKLEALNTELAERAKNNGVFGNADSVRVLVAGSPSVMGNWKLHHIIETSGGTVVCDESCTGTRYFEHAVDENGGSVGELIESIADRYMKIDCSCFSPNNDRIDNVVRLSREYKTQAVIQYVLQYCHAYNVEALRITGALKKVSIPSIVIETDYGEEDEGQLRTRVEALFENVKGSQQ